MKTILLCSTLLVVGFLIGTIESAQVDGERVDKQTNEDGQLVTSSHPMRRENSRMSDLARTSLQSIVDKITSYFTESLSSSVNWINSPYYGISKGVTSVIVVMVVVSILVLVSGTVVTTGRSLGEHLDIDSDQLTQLTRSITKAIDLVADKLTKTISEDLKDRGPNQERKWSANGGGGPSWTASIGQAESISAYISEHFYNTLIWLTKPYAGQIMTLGGSVVYMVVIVMITMTSGVFPLIPSTSGRQTRKSRESESNSGDLVELAKTVMEAISTWDERKLVKNDTNS